MFKTPTECIQQACQIHSASGLTTAFLTLARYIT
jgi:hypothetical protein